MCLVRLLPLRQSQADIASLTAGDDFDVEVLAVDANNVVTSYTGVARLAVAAVNYDYDMVAPTRASFVNGVATISVTHYRSSHNGDTYTLIPSLVSGNALAPNNSMAYTVSPGTATKLLPILSFETHTPGALTRDDATSRTNPDNSVSVNVGMSVTVMAVDDYYNLVTSEAGLVSVSTSDPADVHPSDANLVAGQKTFTVTPKTSGARHVSLSYSGGTQTLTGLDSLDYVVEAAPPSKLIFATLPPTTATATDDFANDAVVM